MNKFKVGTLVLMCVPEHDVNSSNVPSGAIGTIMEAGAYNYELKNDEIAVDFPNHTSETITGWWKVPASWLKPIGGDDLISEEDLADNPYKKFAKTEDLV